MDNNQDALTRAISIALRIEKRLATERAAKRLRVAAARALAHANALEEGDKQKLMWEGAAIALEEEASALIAERDMEAEGGPAEEVACE